MEPFRHIIVIEWSDELCAFEARVPALPECRARAATPEQALTAVLAAADHGPAAERRARQATALRALLAKLGADAISPEQLAAADAELFGR